MRKRKKTKKRLLALAKAYIFCSMVRKVFQVGTKVPEFIWFHYKPSLKTGFNKMHDIKGLQPLLL